MAITPTEHAQVEYMERLRYILRRAPADIREDALREVQTHIEDEWQALGGDYPAMQKVLQRLGPPEAYGRDLALQLMLKHGHQHRSPVQLIQAIFFWASTSLLGSFLVLCATLVSSFGLAMLLVAVWRLRGNSGMLIDASEYQVFGFHADRVRFPPETWSPLTIAVVGLLPTVIVFFVLFRFLGIWIHSRLAERGLELVTGRSELDIKPGWERRVILAMTGFALLGFSSCLFFTIISERVPIGRPGTFSLPDDFIRTPITFLALIGGLLFLCSPVLGLLWAARRSHH